MKRLAWSLAAALGLAWVVAGCAGEEADNSAKGSLCSAYSCKFNIVHVVILANDLVVEYNRREGEEGERNTLKLIVANAADITEATPVVQDGTADRFTAYAYDEDNMPISIEPLVYGSLEVEGGPPTAGEELKGQLTIRRQGPEGEQGLDCRFKAVVEAPDI